IYRITRSDNAPSLPRGIQLSKAPDAELVARLADPNIWWRRTAQRLLVDRRAVGMVPGLSRMAGQNASPVGRLHALWTLEGLGKLEPILIEQALRDTSPGVRENAVRLAEAFSLSGAVIPLASDADAKVRFQALVTLGGLLQPAARTARDQVLFRDIEDRWAQAAALSASSTEAARLLPLALEKARGNATGSPGWSALFRQIGAATSAAAETRSVRKAVAFAANSGEEWWRVALLEGLASGYPRSSQSLRVGEAAERQLLGLSQNPEAALRRAGLLLLEKTGVAAGNRAVAQNARSIAVDNSAGPQVRADAITLASIVEGDREPAFYERFVTLREPDPVQIAALRALRRSSGEALGRFLITNWRNFSSAIRPDAADTLYADPQRVPMILAALKSGDIPAWTLSFRHRRQLMMHRDAAIRESARAILEQSEGARKEVFARYKEALAKEGAAGQGHEVYKRVCAKCHRFRGEGTAVGPDLETVRNQPEVVLLEDILMPSKSIAQNYEAYVVETAAGETLDGVLSEQTAATIVLRHEEGKQDVIPRAQIKRMYATTLSAMPGDLDQQVSPRQMADLLRFLKD
ncbi:MAG: c-type cytochrome, partial [Bryobacteraceae bacterium]